MSDPTPTSTLSAPRPARHRTLKLAAGLAALSLAVLAGLAWHHESSSLAAPQFGSKGSLVAVSLANGQIYYGDLADARATALSLERVYYVQSFTNPATQQTDNRLVNRSKADWHGPSWMTIPMEKILMVERVSPDSRLGQLIAQEKQSAAPAAGASGPN